jgi:hypothetical protein
MNDPRLLRIDVHTQPHDAVSIRFLFVAPALGFRLPSDSQSPETPLPSTNTGRRRLCRGLSPPNECALPGAKEKGPPRMIPREAVSQGF